MQVCLLIMVMWGEMRIVKNMNGETWDGNGKNILEVEVDGYITLHCIKLYGKQ